MFSELISFLIYFSAWIKLWLGLPLQLGKSKRPDFQEKCWKKIRKTWRRLLDELLENPDNTFQDKINWNNFSYHSALILHWYWFLLLKIINVTVLNLFYSYTTYSKQTKIFLRTTTSWHTFASTYHKRIKSVLKQLTSLPTRWRSDFSSSDRFESNCCSWRRPTSSGFELASSRRQPPTVCPSTSCAH